MPDTYIVQTGDSLWGISKKLGVSFQQIKSLNPSLKPRSPPYGISPGDVIVVPPAQRRGEIKRTCEKCNDCIVYQLAKPFLIAKAVDSTIVPTVSLKVRDDVLHGGIMPLGQDITHSSSRALLDGYPATSNDEATLRDAMLRLLDVFAFYDRDEMAKRLFDKFLEKNGQVTIFTDDGLDMAVQASSNFIAFSDRTLAAPGTNGTDPTKPRIHQRLKDAGWDINNVKTIEGLGVPAFNEGTKTPAPLFNSGDWANGLAVMINGVQYVYVYVEKYSYDSCKGKYEIGLKFVLYDVFGLDDDDLREYGVARGVDSIFLAPRGITAWWQLQHQFGYAPVLTRAVVHKTYTVSTVGQ
ncbi:MULTISPECIES: LysM domain-containing protein [Sorangium]|uniref:LysM domain-containing protein n=1 Tax=Sorangium cellulosum TaxID=56 RepID=A0A4P2R5T8_SORCE|nr:MULTISPECIES: LysM domain-containing protein [Sorangium]AUX38489.1 uncharacterized protein SOCE836_107330 [Sorangium cellulosum]WCQ97778.1 hypothetical protein NQZ70_10576 [Sorangium sp. Soce836]